MNDDGGNYAGTDPEKAALHAALDQWAREWATHRGTGEEHAAAIVAWATPARPAQPARPPASDTRSREQRAWQWQDLVTAAMGRVKERRGVSLYERLPDDDTRHCGKPGCPCVHSRYRPPGHSQGDWCDRGFIPTPDDPDGEQRIARCPTCRRHAEATKAIAP